MCKVSLTIIAKKCLVQPHFYSSSDHLQSEEMVLFKPAVCEDK